MDPNQLEQILVNLVVNARDAMPSGGRLKIVLGRLEEHDELRSRLDDLEPGHYMDLAVEDSSHGMTEEVREHIFEPFFTTEEPGIGTGLGLSMVYGTVMQSGGRIHVESAPGQGTTFHVLLPLVAEPVEVAGELADRPRARRGSGVVPMVEDEASLLELGQIVLSKAGYRVLTARDGVEALEVVDGHSGALDLLVTDVVMPRMNGGELARNLQTRLPGLKVLSVSGHSENAICHHGVIGDGVNLLRKPYRPAALANRVTELLGREPEVWPEPCPSPPLR